MNKFSFHFYTSYLLLIIAIALALFKPVLNFDFHLWPLVFLLFLAEYLSAKLIFTKSDYDTQIYYWRIRHENRKERRHEPRNEIPKSEQLKFMPASPVFLTFIVAIIFYLLGI